MTRAQALRHVAGYVAGLLEAGTFEEATGFHEADVSAADADRLAWAAAEVARRLGRIATPPTPRRTVKG